MKNKVISISFSLFLIIIFILNIVIKDKDISYTERRKLQNSIPISIDNVLDGSLFKKFDTYTLDQFILRDEFRSIKTYISLNVYNKMDNNDLVYKDGYIYKLNKKVDEKSVNNFIDVINNFKDKYLINNKVYLSLIPDKSYYLDDSYLKIDYDYLVNKVSSNINASYIDIFPYLNINSYYKTDSHWSQDKIIDATLCLASVMDSNIDTNFITNKYDNFYGVYYGQLGLNISGDELVYLSNSIIDNASVYNYESNFNKVYDLDKLNGMDCYDIYLSGASSYIEIKNNNATNDRELVIFRDSFGSSIAPLLLSGYSKIILIDLRYIDNDNIEKLIKFDNQDVLFLYSTMLVNESGTLKK